MAVGDQEYLTCGSGQPAVGTLCLFQLFKYHWQYCKTSLEEEICFTTHLLQLCSLLSALSDGKGRLEWNQAEKCWHHCLSTHTHPPPASTCHYCHDATINCIEQTRGYVKCNEKLKQSCLRGSKAWRWNSQENNSNSLMCNSNSSDFKRKCQQRVSEPDRLTTC